MQFLYRTKQHHYESNSLFILLKIPKLYWLTLLSFTFPHMQKNYTLLHTKLNLSNGRQHLCILPSKCHILYSRLLWEQCCIISDINHYITIHQASFSTHFQNSYTSGKFRHIYKGLFFHKVDYMYEYNVPWFVGYMNFSN